MRCFRTTVLVLALFLIPVDSAANTQLPESCMVTVNEAGDPGLPQHVIPGYTTLHTPEGRVELPVYPEEYSMYGQNGLWFRIPDSGQRHPRATGRGADQRGWHDRVDQVRHLPG